MIKFYHIVAFKDRNAPFFSPTCILAHVAFLTKRVPFEIVEVTYDDVRSVYWRERLQVNKVTAPFIERDDGSLLMDSVEIAKWLDQAYPDRTNLFLPEADLPVDVNSDAYVAAKERHQAFVKTCEGVTKPDHKLWAPPLVRSFDRETGMYWTSDARLGPGVWASVCAATTQDKAASVKAVQDFLDELTSERLAGDRLFFSSSSKPGMEDFHLFGHYSMVRAASALLAAELFETPASGTCREWLERMYALYPLEDVRVRNPIASKVDQDREAWELGAMTVAPGRVEAALSAT